mmetsp:Transcript_19942/g.63210  ORF Transcript_19942/g.63210 Transcript_19942/m.63210 type:complete len:259 (+) Transcript_19942:1343-2119(+)
MRLPPAREPEVDRVEGSAGKAPEDAHERKDGEFPDQVGPWRESSKLHRHVCPEHAERAAVVHWPEEAADSEGGHRRTEEAAQQDRGTHVRGTLLDGKQNAADRRAERRRHARGSPGGGQVPGLAALAVGAHEGPSVPPGNQRGDTGPAVDHGALLPARQACGHTEDDAGGLAQEGTPPEHSGHVDAVQVALDLGDATAGSKGLHEAHERPGHRCQPDTNAHPRKVTEKDIVLTSGHPVLKVKLEIPGMVKRKMYRYCN